MRLDTFLFAGDASVRLALLLVPSAFLLRRKSAGKVGVLPLWVSGAAVVVRKGGRWVRRSFEGRHVLVVQGVEGDEFSSELVLGEVYSTTIQPAPVANDAFR
jgi:hypothetical protein